MESVRSNIKTVIFEYERHTWPSSSSSSLTAVNTHKVTLLLVWKIIDCIISREPHAYLVCAISPSVAALLCFCPVVSRSRGLEHHLYLHPCSARERRGLQPRPAEELPNPGPVSPGPTSTHLLHLPTHCSQVPLYLQPARPLQHIPGDTLIENTQKKALSTQTLFQKNDLRFIFSQLNVRSWIEKVVLVQITSFSVTDEELDISPRFSLFLRLCFPRGKSQASVTNFSSKLLLI